MRVEWRVELRVGCRRKEKERREKEKKNHQLMQWYHLREA
jgi:hypothetical protein